MPSASSSVVPPAPPWLELNSPPTAGGYLSIYYSDDLSRLPVRWVTKPGDNKSDPNLETLTYGLFSTCSPGMRSGVVRRRCSYLFFTTMWRGQRVVTGYYHVRWYAAGAFGGRRDFCLAADSGRFVEKPIPLTEVDRKCGMNVAGRFRGMRLLSGEECRKLARLLDAQPNAILKYLEEIDRLERFNLKHGKYRYIAWKQSDKFSWDLARSYFERDQQTGPAMAVRNSSPSGSWKCTRCNETIRNRALLKRCPRCGELGALRPQYR